MTRRVARVKRSQPDSVTGFDLGVGSVNLGKGGKNTVLDGLGVGDLLSGGLGDGSVRETSGGSLEAGNVALENAGAECGVKTGLKDDEAVTDSSSGALGLLEGADQGGGLVNGEARGVLELSGSAT